MCVQKKPIYMQTNTACILLPKDGKIALRSATNLSTRCFLALPASESSFTEIFEYIDFSLMQTAAEFKYKSDSNPLALVIGPIPFL